MSRTVAVLLFCLLFVFLPLCQADASLYVVNTNWSGTGFSPGDGFLLDDGRFGYHGHQFTLGYNSYRNSVTDDRSLTSQELSDFISAINAYTEDGIVVYNNIDEIPSGGFKGDVPEVQLIVNHAIDTNPSETAHGGAMFSILLPPGFSRSRADRYPIVINSPGHGAHGTNKRVFGLPDTVGGTYTPSAPDGHKIAAAHDVVFVYWTAGGYQSMSVNSEARDAMEEFIELLYTDFHCDREKIIAFGESRGGFASMTLAENCVNGTFDYNVIGVFVHAVPCSLGELGQRPISTYPTFASMYPAILEGNTQRYTSSNPYYTSPEVFRPAFGPAEDDETVSLTFNRVNSMCPDYSDNLAHLADKYVFIGYGTHDGYFPLNYAVAMDNELSTQGIEHSFVYCLRTGHGPTCSDLRLIVLEDFLTKLTANLDTFDPAAYEPPAPVKKGTGGFARHYLEDLDRHMHQKNNFRNLYLRDLPFAATIPLRLGCNVFGDGTPELADEPGVIDISGAADKDWALTLTNLTTGPGTRTKTWTGTFDATESHTVKWGPWYTGDETEFPVEAHNEAPANQPIVDEDQLEWSFTFDTIPLDSAACVNWTDGSSQPIPTVTKVSNHQPFPADIYVWDDNGYGIWSPDSILICLGVDQIPVLEDVVPYLKCSPQEITLNPGGSVTWHEVELYSLVGNNSGQPVTGTSYSIGVRLPNGNIQHQAGHVGPVEQITPEEAIVLSDIDTLLIKKNWVALAGGGDTGLCEVIITILDGDETPIATGSCDLVVHRGV